MQINVEVNKNGMTDLDEAYFNLEASLLAMNGLADIAKNGTVPDPMLYSIKTLIEKTRVLIEPYVTMFCTKCGVIFEPYPCKCDKKQEKEG